MATNVKEIILDNKFLRNQNSNHRAYMQDLADFIQPRKAWITSIRTNGERLKFNFLYDSTAILALRDAASNFHTNLSDATSRWFSLETLDKNHMRSHDVRTYFKEVEDVMFSTLNRSNYYNIIQEFYTDFIGFSPGSFSMLSDSKDFVRFQSIPVKESIRVTDANGRLSEFHRNFRLSSRQAVKMWGDNVGKEVLDSFNESMTGDGQFKEFEFIHYTGPRHVRDVSKKDSVNMPIQSLWISVKGEHLIKESGFIEMPIMSDVFYSDSDDPNGFSPAMDILPVIKLVNAQQRTFIRSDMKNADPPLILPSRGFILPLNLNPGKANYRDAKSTSEKDLQLMPRPAGGLSTTIDHISRNQDIIREGFFVPLFRSLTDITKQMTIPEVQQRIAENMKILGPVVGRILHGIHDPTIIRLFNMLQRAGMLPDPPQEIQDQDFTPVYLSNLAKVQKQSQITDIQLYLGDIAAVGEVKPAIYDNVNEDKLANVMARLRGVTPEIQNEEQDIAEMRQKRAEQDDLIAQLQAGQGVAGIAKDGASAEKSLAEASA